jgi:tetratricopeptide (TPR) repeat protein
MGRRLLVLAILAALGATAWIVARQRELRATRGVAPSAGGPLASATSTPEPERPTLPSPKPDESLSSQFRFVRDWERTEQSTLLEIERNLDRGMVEEARRLATRVLETNPDSLTMREMLGWAQLQGGNLASATTNFLAVLRADPRRTKSRAGLAEVALKQERFDVALDAARWILDQTAQDTRALRIASRAALEVGEYAAAQRYLRSWLDQQPQNREAKDLLGLCYLRLGEYGKATFYLSELCRDGNATEATYLNLALAHAQAGQTSEVVRVLSEAVERLSVRTVASWFSRADMANLRDQPQVALFLDGVLKNTAPALTVQLPERPTVTPETTLGLLPPPDILSPRYR